MAASRSRFWLSNFRNHYEVLGLERTCTAKEIRTAFVKLSKELHPDGNLHDTSRHEKFVKLNEAYSVLCKSETRRQYDLLLSTERARPFVDMYQMRSAAETHQRRQNYGTGFWNDRDHFHDSYNDAKHYYGIKGLNKVPNWYVVIGCCMVILVGAMGHYLALMYGNRVSRVAQDQKDRLYSSQYEEARSQAKIHGNAIQIELLRQRVMENENFKK